MNYIKHLSGFFDKVSKDDRLNPTHVSLYVSLFQFWNACRFHNPISISRNEAMRVSKISSKATYHKCIRELNDFGYLSYHPSYNPFKGSLVYLFNFQAGVNKKDNQHKIETGSELVGNRNDTKIETSSEQALVSYTNIINNTKQQTEVNENSKTKSYEKRNNSSKNDCTEYAGKAEGRNPERQPRERKKGSAGVEVSLSLGEGRKGEAGSGSGFQRPLREEARHYFTSKQWPEKEADKFYNHYESNGWLVGGKAPMQNWQASADNWILNSDNFSSLSTKKSNAPDNMLNKDYSEPL